MTGEIDHVNILRYFIKHGLFDLMSLVLMTNCQCMAAGLNLTKGEWFSGKRKSSALLDISPLECDECRHCARIIEN